MRTEVLEAILGDIHFLGTDIEWVKGLLRNHQVPDEELYDYLGACHKVGTEHLGTEDPGVDWLGELLGRRSSN